MGADSDRLWRRQLFVIIFTYFAYAGLNGCRKSFAYAKDIMQTDWNINEYWLGALDGTLMFSYSIGLYITGRIADRYNPSYCLGWGLFGCGFLNIFFSLSYPYFNMNIDNSYIYYLLIWILNGFAQAICWPASIKLIGNWISLSPQAMIKTYNKSGLIFGLWASCQSFGNILGAISVTIVLSNKEHSHDIQYSFFIIGFYTIFFAVLTIFFIPEKPDINLINAAAADMNENNDNSQIPKTELTQLNEQSDDLENDQFEQEQVSLSYIEIISLPGVLTYCICFSCLKALNYTLFFWLPLYLDDMLSSDIQADNISMSFDFGQIIGGLIIGFYSDKILKRSPILFISMLIATIPVFLFAIDSKSIGVLFFLCLLSGLFIGGPYNLIPSAIAQDLSQIQQLKGNKSVIASIAGLINGSGSFCAATIQFFVPVILSGKHEDKNWTDLYVVLGFVSLIGTLSLIKMVIKDLRFISQYPVSLKRSVSKSFRKYSSFRLFRQQ